MKKSLATKKKLEELSARIVNNGLASNAQLLIKTPQYVKQYVMMSEASEKCLELGRLHGEKVVRQYISELKELFKSTVNVKLKRAESKTLDEQCSHLSLSESVEIKMSAEDTLFALMEEWSRADVTADSLASQVYLAESLVEMSCDQSEKTDDEAVDETVAASSLDEVSNQFPLNMLLEITVKHYNDEYKSLLSEPQMTFMTNYVSLDPDQFVVKVLIPLEEHAKRSVGKLSGDSTFGADQLETVTTLLERFQTDRSFVSNVSHPQHSAAIDFYLSLIDLTEKINTNKGNQEKS
jgi:hypothetical protein